jgi:CarD family transcriptional regulator
MEGALRTPPTRRLGEHVAYTSGDTVVHPRHGVATVQGIATRGVGKGRTSFLELAFASTSLKILVPVDSVDEVGIRKLLTKREAETILSILAGPSDVSETWSERTASTTSRLRSTELAQASMVIRDLTRHARRSGKPLSTSENAILHTCLDSVSSELAVVLEMAQEDARTLILEKATSED